MAGKNTLDKRKTPFAFPLTDRAYGSRSSSASFKYFHYVKQNFGKPTNLQPNPPSDDEIMKVEQGYVEDEIASIKISKSISQASGTFNISLLPSKNWKQVLSPGDWIIIYFQDDFDKSTDRYQFRENNKNLMMLGNIDRISRSLTKNEDDDKNELRYVVSGRSFGKVFEETDVWYDPYAIQRDTLNRVVMVNSGLELLGSPDSMCESLIDIFLGNGSTLSQGRVEGIANWRIPAALRRLFGGDLDFIGEAKFYDILTKKIQKNLPGFKQRQMITLNSNGSLHDMLKRCSNDLVNELYYEEIRRNDGKVEPTVVLKTRPTNTLFLEEHIDKVEPMKAQILDKIAGTFKTLQDYSDENFVEISKSEILYEDMGKDDHSRFNMYWLKPITSAEHVLSYAANNNATQGLANPTFSAPSIQRHGLKRFDQILEFCHSNDSSSGGANNPDIVLWKAFMLQLYDMHFANHLYEAGTIECTGVLEAELGKALIILPTNKNAMKKVYLIEGYEHDWTFPNKWTTKFTLTHGQFKTQGSQIFIDTAEADFGDTDKDIDTIYLAKTESQR